MLRAVIKRRVHMAHQISSRGGVSPLCADKPRRINMGAKSRETWTTCAAAVTCKKCRARMEAA
jgi:hypothetical protein